MEPKHYDIAVYEAERRLEEAGYVRGINAALKALPKKWKPKYEEADSVAPNGWCSTCDALLGTDGECLCYVQNKAIEEAHKAIKNIKTA